MGAPGREGARIVLRLWNLAWDAGLAGVLLAAALVLDRFVVHKGYMWALAAAAAGFAGCEIGARLGWWLVFRVLGGRARD